jgi:hypothetical protein
VLKYVETYHIYAFGWYINIHEGICAVKLITNNLLSSFYPFLFPASSLEVLQLMTRMED